MTENFPAKPKTPVLIAVPMRRFDPKSAEADVPEHLQQLLAALTTDAGLPWTFEMMVFGGGNVSRGRNKIVATFLRGRWVWIIFIDDDILAKDTAEMKDAVIRILSHRKHVCGGLYTKKEDGAGWVVNAFREPTIDADGLLVVPELGTGGMKTYHRSVFTTMIEKCAAAGNPLDYVCDETAAPEWAFFCQARRLVDGKPRWLPEDYWCDQLCRDCGIPVHVDTQVKLRHLDVASGVTYPIDDEWPALPGPMSPVMPPPMAEDLIIKDPVDRLLIEAAVGKPVGKLVIALQYWAGDRAAAMRLAKFMADLEPDYRSDVVLRLVGRHDAVPFDPAMIECLARKFAVLEHTSPLHKPGYPQSPNVMALDVMQSAAGWDCDAVLLLEADCVPVAKDWIDQLRIEWARANAAGALVLGSWRGECTMRGHINGNLLFHPSMAYELKLPAKPPRKAWDIVFVQYFHERWMRTGLIANRYQEMFVTPEKLAVPECGTRPPVLIHGIKDESAWKYAQAQTGVKA